MFAFVPRFLSGSVIPSLCEIDVHLCDASHGGRMTVAIGRQRCLNRRTTYAKFRRSVCVKDTESVVINLGLVVVRHFLPIGEKFHSEFPRSGIRLLFTVLRL